MATFLDTFGSRTAITITLGSLASSTAGAGRQGTIVDNTATRFDAVQVMVKAKLGTSPTGRRGVYVYLIRDDNTDRTDGAGASDAALTVKNAECLGVLTSGPSATTGDVLVGAFHVERPGPRWTVAITHDTGVALDATGHAVAFVGLSRSTA
jgi:hypothetical protein